MYTRRLNFWCFHQSSALRRILIKVLLWHRSMNATGIKTKTKGSPRLAFHSCSHHRRGPSPKLASLMGSLPKNSRKPVLTFHSYIQSTVWKVFFGILLLCNIAVISVSFLRRTKAGLSYVSKTIPRGEMDLNKSESFSSLSNSSTLKKQQQSLRFDRRALRNTTRTTKKKILIRNNIETGLDSSWNKSALMDPSISEHIFTLENLDHVMAFQPLCFSTTDGTAFTTTRNLVCSGTSTKSSWNRFFCTTGRNSVYRELHLDIHHAVEPSEMNSSTIWIEGQTALSVLDRSCGNVAHYAGRIFMLHHVLHNAKAYTGNPIVNRVVVIPSFYISSRFDNTHVNRWHHSVLSAVAAPAKLTVSSLNDFLKYETNRGSKNAAKFSVVHILKELSSISVTEAEENEKRAKYVCFRKAIVPGFLKGRFFVSDTEYPSTSSGWGQSVDGSVEVPRDSEELRRRIDHQIGERELSMGHRKSIVFLNRVGSRRVFDKQGQTKVTKLMQEVAAANGCDFMTVNFEGMNFMEQVFAVRHAHIAIGMHGANLVNTLFMDALSVLIEVMPYGFKHEMYKNGGNAGLKYFVHQMSEGDDYDELKKYESAEECVKKNEACKVYYRDALQRVTQRDLNEIRGLLEAAIAWHASP